MDVVELSSPCHYLLPKVKVHLSDFRKLQRVRRDFMAVKDCLIILGSVEGSKYKGLPFRPLSAKL
jgi:hypothetical protein